MIKIQRYGTLDECMLSFFEADTLPEGQWRWMDGERYRVWPMRRVLRNRRKVGTWGWCENKERLHIWIAEHAKPERIIRLLAHELGHMQRPWHRTSDEEEAKAEQYASVAQTAWEIMTLLEDR